MVYLNQCGFLMSNYYSGRVTRIVFARKSQGFYILKMSLDSEGDKSEGPFKTQSLSDPFGSKYDDLVVVKGYIPGLEVKTGLWFGFEAKWVTDPKYGRQLSINRAPVLGDWIDPSAVVRMLRENGVDDMIAYRLEKVFGKDLCVALENTDRVKKEMAISSFDAEFITNRWKRVKNKYLSLELAYTLSIPRRKVAEIWEVFGEDAEKVLRERPWDLVYIDGIRFSEMDKLAQKAGLSLDSPERLESAVVYATRKGLQHGDLYLTTDRLLGGVNSLVGDQSNKRIAQAVKDAIDNSFLYLDTETKRGLKAVYLFWAYLLEEESAEMLCSRLQITKDRDDLWGLTGVGPKTESVFDSSASVEEVIKTAIEECSEDMGFHLSEEQSQALFNALRYSVSVVSGLPGTGKSTSMKVLVEILRRSTSTMLLMAPTGIAAKRLGSVTQEMSYTIHRALRARATEEKKRDSSYVGVTGDALEKKKLQGPHSNWGHDRNEPHHADYIIIDEFSMVDQNLLFRILSGTLPQATLVFVGDAAQLPSVGPGNVLRGIINSETVPVTRLTKIFRQKETSDIVTAAHAIFRGEVPQTDVKSDFCLIEQHDQSVALQIILKIVGRLYEKASDWDEGPPPSFQVLSPRHRGVLGVTNLNIQIRDVVNPPKRGLKELGKDKDLIREGDRVMIIKNDYGRDVYNGDIGKIVSIDLVSKRVRVKIHGINGKSVTFNTYEAMKMLRLAYACTVHKYQGLEVDTVIMPLVPQFGRQLQRNLLYTAITRAKKKVVLVGSQSALTRAVQNTKEDERNTLLVERLQYHFGKIDERDRRSEEEDEGVALQSQGDADISVSSSAG